MNLGFLLDSGSRSAGGLFDATRRLAQSLLTDGDHVTTFCTSDDHIAEDAAQWPPVKLQVHARRFPAMWGYAPTLPSALLAADLDVLMTHGLWQYCSVASLAWQRKTRRPLIIHPHGMLDPWAMKHSQGKKRLASLLYERAHLRSAACLRALCAPEAEAIRTLGLRNSVCIIPNGVDLPDVTVSRPAPWGDHARGRHVLLYLGRLHPKKNLPALLDAWSALQRDASQMNARDWTLVIAGWDQGGHEAALRQRAQALGLSADAVHFPGPLFGESKAAAYQHASAFILPSLSEGLPMVVLEAWAHALPVLMTDACNLPVGFTTGSAWRITTDSSGIQQGLIDLISRTDQERRTAGENGRALVADHFSWQKVGAQMREVTQWLVDGTAAPASLFP